MDQWRERHRIYCVFSFVCEETGLSWAGPGPKRGPVLSEGPAPRRGSLITWRAVLRFELRSSHDTLPHSALNWTRASNDCSHAKETDASDRTSSSLAFYWLLNIKKFVHQGHKVNFLAYRGQFSFILSNTKFLRVKGSTKYHSRTPVLGRYKSD